MEMWKKCKSVILGPWRNPRIIPWVILTFSTIIMVFLGGQRRGFGMFIADLKTKYKGISLAELNWIGNFCSALGYITTPLTTALILHFCHLHYKLFQFVGACLCLFGCVMSSFVPNPHWLFLTHSLLNGLSASLVLSVVGLVIDEHFPRDHSYRILATTLISGGSVAAIAFVMFFAYLIETFNWRGAFLILAATYFLIYSTGFIFFQTNVDSTSSKDERSFACAKCNSWRETIPWKQIPLLVAWTIDRILTSAVTYGLLLNLGHFQIRTEGSLVKASVLTTLLGAGEASACLLSILIMAFTKTFFHNRLKFIILVSSIFMSILLIVWEQYQNNTLASELLAYFCGLCLGPSVSFLFPGGEEITTLRGHVAYPFSLVGMGIGMIISPFFTAYVAERSNYKMFFLIQGVMVAVKCGALLFACFYIWWFQIHCQEEENKCIRQSDSNSSSIDSTNQHNYGSVKLTPAVSTDMINDKSDSLKQSAR